MHFKRLLYTAILLINYSIIAQTNGVVSGYVNDLFGVPIADANIVLLNTSYGAVTDDEGYFEINALPPNNYSVEISHLGYETYTRYNIQVQSSGNQIYKFELIPSVNELEGVEIVDYFSYRSKETPMSTQTFSAVEIANYPGGNNDVVRVAQSLPGVAPSIGGFRNDLIIRGGAPNEVVYFLDGIELTAINHFSTQGSSGGPAGMLNVSFIDEVTLNSSSFQASVDNALSGVLNFKQREAPQNTKQYNIRVGASESALTFMGPLSNSKSERPITAIASIRRSYLQFLFKVIGLPIRPDYWDYQFKIKKDLDPKNSLQLIGLGSIDEFSVVAPNSELIDQIATAQQVPFIEQNTSNLGLSWNRTFTNTKGNSQLSLSYNFKNNRFSRYTDNVAKQGLIYQKTFDETYYQFRYQSNFYIEDLKLSVGLNHKNILYEHQIDTPAELETYPRLHLVQNGSFVQASTDVLDHKVSLSGGLRLEHINFANENHFFTSPRASLSYRIGTNTKFNASIGKYIKIPPLTILGYRENNQLINADTFEPTQSNHLAIGFETYLNQGLLVSIEGFKKDYYHYPVSLKDDISLGNKGGDFEVLGDERVSYTGRGFSKGIELMLQQKFIDKGYGILSYTLFNSKFNNGTGSYLPSSWDSRHLISFTGGIQLSRNWTISSRYRYAGKTPYASINQEKTIQNYPLIYYDFSTLDNNRLPSFSQLDLRFDKKWNHKQNTLEFYIEIQNALKSNIPQAPQYALITGENNEPQLINATTDSEKIIPTLGIVIDF